MTWKGTAASSLLSLAAMSWWGVVSQPAAPDTPVAVRSAVPASAPSEIQRQAEKLQARLHPVANYEAPSRNPFRFGAVAAAPAVRVTMPAPIAPLVDAAPAVPEAPRMSLAGIAADIVEGATVRTAVISTPLGVQMVKEGDVLEPGYRVSAVEDEAVELVGGDGVPRRLTLGGR